MQVFISYAKEDIEAAKYLYSRLKSLKSVKPWIDIVDILPGENWNEAILRAIDQSRYVIILLSNSAVNKQGYIQKELRFILDKLLTYPPGEIHTIPARIEECKPKHKELNELQWIDLYKGWQTGFLKILTALNVPISEEFPRVKIVNGHPPVGAWNLLMTSFKEPPDEKWENFLDTAVRKSMKTENDE